MKKGDSHLDWIISFGIFIVYIVFLFTILNPIKIENSNQEILFDIAEQNLREDLKWQIIKVPIFVHYNEVSLTNKDICLELYPFSWSADKLVLKKDINDLDFSLNEANCGVAFTSDVDNGVNVFNLIYNERQNIIHNWQCFDPDPLTGCNYLQSFEYSYDYGLPETLTGISLQNFNTLILESSDNIKQRWNFPATNNFNVSLLDLNHNLINNYFFDSSNVEKENIFVTEYADKILNDDATVENVVVHIEVW